MCQKEGARAHEYAMLLPATFLGIEPVRLQHAVLFTFMECPRAVFVALGSGLAHLRAQQAYIVFLLRQECTEQYLDGAADT